MNRESKVQQECVKRFRELYPKDRLLLFAVPNGGSRNFYEAVRLKAEGVLKGVADILLLKPMGEYHGLCIEMKTQYLDIEQSGHIVTRRSYQSTEQKQWQMKVEEQGYRYAVCRTVEEFLNEIRNYYATGINSESNQRP